MLTPYIALLRGVNVGGKNKIAMPMLKKELESIGFVAVRTYINSGNILFASHTTCKTTLIQQIENMIIARFTLHIPVSVLSVQEWEYALSCAPAWWNQPSNENTVHHAIFIIPPLTSQEIQAIMGEGKPEYERLAYYQNIIFWSAPRATISKTTWHKVISSPIYHGITIRNANTTLKLLSLAKEMNF